MHVAQSCSGFLGRKVGFLYGYQLLLDGCERNICFTQYVDDELVIFVDAVGISCWHASRL
jgi:hypothetical protein